jgi:2,3-bisphosphoglycerate-dependent phosphoglycerate mutase
MAVTRVLVARHAAAEYENDLLTDDGGSLTVAGRAQAMELGDNLEGEGIVHVWTSSLARAVQTAELAATALVCSVTVREGLREFGVGAHAGQPLAPDPLGPTFLKWLDGDLDARIEGGESGNEIAARVAAVLNEVAAAHPGGTVLVLSHGGSMGVGLPALAANLEQDFPKDHPIPNCGVVELEHDDEGDGDGWRAVRWVDIDVTDSA